jgi:hypothetical protein
MGSSTKRWRTAPRDAAMRLRLGSGLAVGEWVGGNACWEQQRVAIATQNLQRPSPLPPKLAAPNPPFCLRKQRLPVTGRQHLAEAARGLAAGRRGASGRGGHGQGCRDGEQESGISTASGGLFRRGRGLNERAASRAHLLCGAR